MGCELRGEVALAEAVVALAIKDVLHGTSDQRRKAREDIASGGLDCWVDVVCLEGRGSDALWEALRGLLVSRADAA